MLGMMEEGKDGEGEMQKACEDQGDKRRVKEDECRPSTSDSLVMGQIVSLV